MDVMQHTVDMTPQDAQAMNVSVLVLTTILYAMILLHILVVLVEVVALILVHLKSNAAKDVVWRPKRNAVEVANT